MKPVKLCYVVSTRGVEGGANRSLLDLLSELRRQNRLPEAIGLMSARGSMTDALEGMGIRTYVVPFANAAAAPNPLKTLGKRVYNVFALPKLTRILLDEGVTLLHNNSLPTTLGMEAARRLGIPYLCHIRENVRDGLGMRLYDPKAVRRCIEGAAAVVAISDYIAASYRDFAPKAEPLVLPDGIAAEAYEAKREILTRDGAGLISVGAVYPQKGQALAWEAVQALNERGRKLTLTLVGPKGAWRGDTAYADALWTAAERDPRLITTGAVEDLDTLRALRGGADLNVVCSSAEGLGRTTIEGMLAGLLTIAADAGATPELVKDGETGLLFSAGDPKTLEARIEWALDHPDEARRIAARGQIEAKRRFAIAPYAARIADLYQSAAANAGITKN